MKIILIDDESSMREIIPAILRQHHFTTYEVPDELLGHKAHFDLLITDGQMMGRTYKHSIENANVIGYITPPNPVIVYSGSDEIVDTVISEGGIAIVKDWEGIHKLASYVQDLERRLKGG